MLQQIKRWLAVSGSLAVLAFLALGATSDKFGYVGLLLRILPDDVARFVGTPDGTLLLILIATGLIWWAIRNPIRSVSLKILNAVSPLLFRHVEDGHERWMLTIIVRIVNTGEPTCLVDWQASATLDGREVALRPTIIATSFDLAGGGMFGPAEDIMRATIETPIGTGAVAQGILLCLSDEETVKNLIPRGTVKIKCKDVREVEHSATFECKTASKAAAFYPGLGRHNQRPIGPAMINMNGATLSNSTITDNQMIVAPSNPPKKNKKKDHRPAG